MDIEAKLRQLCDKEEIRDLEYKFARGADRNDAKLLASVFWEDATIDFAHFQGSTADWVKATLEFKSKFTFYHHMMANILIELDGDKAYLESYTSDTFCMKDNPPFLVKDQKILNHVTARYLSRAERRGGEWRFSYRRAIGETREIRVSSAPGPTWTGDPDFPSAARDDRTDPSFAHFRKWGDRRD